MRRTALFAPLALFAWGLFAVAAPARAADPPSSKAGGAPGTNIDMPFLMAPMVGADGELAGYAYISSRLTATSDAATARVRDKIAFIQDAFVRDVNGAAITKPGDPASLDMPGLQARLLADAKRVMGKGAIASLALMQVQIASLHPRETQALSPPPELTPATPAKPGPATPAPAAPAKKGG